MVDRFILYGRETIRYEVVYRPSRRTLGVEVHPDSRVLVRAPEGCPQAVIEDRLRQRARWISRQLREFEGYRPRTPPRQYLSGESHLLLGRAYRLKVVAGDANSVARVGQQLVVTLTGRQSRDRVRDALEAWYREQAKVAFAAALDKWVPRIPGASRPRVLVRAMRSRWGSLAQSGTMTLNVVLARAPRPCIEYVIVHELCHQRHRAHDERFFGLLERFMPDWQARKRLLERATL